MTGSLLQAAAAASERTFRLVDGDGRLAEPSPSWCTFTGQAPAEALGHGGLGALLEEVRAGESSTRAVELPLP